MTELVPVTRPNGKVYKPRKPPRAQLVEDPSASAFEPSAWVFVLGTHDVDRAFELAEPVARAEGMRADKESATRTWVRLAMRDGEQIFDRDAERGAAAVTFDLTD